MRPALTPAGRRERAGRRQSTALRRSTAFAIQRIDSTLRSVREVAPPATRADEAWQRDAYAYTAAIGEVGYGVHHKADTVGRCRLLVEERDPETGEWARCEDPMVNRVGEELEGPTGGQSELLRAGSIHLDVAGEAYLVGTPIPGTPVGMTWELLSPLEIRVDGPGRVQRLRYGLGSPEWVEERAFVARMHRRDPANSERADSPLRRVLPVCSELLALTQVVAAIAASRLNAGIWFVPWEVSFGPDDDFENPGDGHEVDSWDQFEEELTEHVNDPIDDRSSPSSLLPMFMRGPAHIDGNPTKELMGMIDLSRPLDDNYRELRDEALHRLNRSLDWPPEMIEGLAGATHWNSNTIRADFIGGHVVATGEFLANFLTDAYLRTRLAFLGFSEAGRYRYRFDPSPVAAKVDTGPAATEAWLAGELTTAAWFEALGLDPADIASEDERVVRLVLTVARANPQILPGVLPVLFPDSTLAGRLAEALAGADLVAAEGDAVRDPAPPARPDGDRSEPLSALLDSVLPVAR